MPTQFTSGNDTLTVDPDLTLDFTGNGGGGGRSVVVEEAFERYKKIIFKHSSKLAKSGEYFDINRVTIIVHSDNEEVNFFVHYLIIGIHIVLNCVKCI